LIFSTKFLAFSRKINLRNFLRDCVKILGDLGSLKNRFFLEMAEGNKKRILLAEDDFSMRRFIEVILKGAGYDVVSVEDGVTAADFLLKDDFDCVIADAIMPNLSGFDLCRMIQTNRSKMPCIIMSGLENQETPQEENTDLFDAFITKDEKLKENLLSTLKNLLDEA
jgi:CheY-like chemotaxis protein